MRVIALQDRKIAQALEGCVGGLPEGSAHVCLVGCTVRPIPWQEKACGARGHQEP